MRRIDLAELRPKLDLENRYVDFHLIRTALTVRQIVEDSGVSLSPPAENGECRGSCPKCEKPRSFVLNINTNRFICFAKGCALKGAGVIDFTAKLYEIPAKEASHRLACAYGISPYGQEPVEENQEKTNAPAQVDQPEQNRGEVSRAEFVELERRVERLTTLVWSLMFENDLGSQQVEASYDKQESVSQNAA